MSDKPTDSTDSGTEESDVATENVADEQASVVPEWCQMMGHGLFLADFGVS